MKTGKFVISLDFELMYGLSDLKNLEEYKPNILGARKVIPILLELFEAYGIHSTWATVGMLFFENKKDMMDNIPAIKPCYKDMKYSNYTYLDTIKDNESLDPYHFAKSIIYKIKQVPYQEIASHTFSHYYCREEGPTIEEFDADINAAVKAAEKSNIKINSLVFPRNQFNEYYLEVLNKYNIYAVRGNEEGILYRPAKFNENKFKRLFRLMDSYINLSGQNCYEICDLERICGVINIPSSRFFRPYSNILKLFEPLKIRRIKNQMEFAAKKGLIFHLWWHPHNFGGSTEKNIEDLLKVLKYYEILHDKYGFKSCNMSEIANEVIHNEDCHTCR
jgi:hypothetical protein